MTKTELRIVRQVGMYGDCKNIAAYVGQDNFGGAHFVGSQLIWYVSVINRDGSVSEYNVYYTDDSEAAMQEVEAILRLAYRSNYAPVRAEAA